MSYPGDSPTVEATEFTVEFWANLVTAPVTDTEFAMPGGRTLTTNLLQMARAQFPATHDQIAVFVAELQATIADVDGRWFGAERGGVERVRDPGLDGRSGFRLTTVGDPCPPLDRALETAGLLRSHLLPGASTRTMPAYVSVSLSLDEPEALAWRHPNWSLPQCPAMGPASPEQMTEFAVKYPDPCLHYLDHSQVQCGYQKFHSGDHDSWRIATRA